MGKKIKSWFVWFAGTFQFPSDLFGFGPGGRRLVREDGTPNSPFWFGSTEDAWRHDWENIGDDFRRAASRLEREIA